VSEVLDKKLSLPDELRNLCGIGYIEGFIVDESGEKDIILFGHRSKERPALHLDDLIVNMRNIGLSEDYPYCSLEPRNEDVVALNTLSASNVNFKTPEEIEAFFQKLKSTVGPQQVIVDGVPRNSRHAHVMIDADYHMKKVSQGHVEVAGVTSYLDRSLDEERKAVLNGATSVDEKVSMARFWFHIDPCEPNDSNYRDPCEDSDSNAQYPLFQEADGIVWLEQCPVVVLTQQQMSTSTGELHDINKEDPIANAFAKELSREFPNLTRHVPAYADLENLYRLRALLLAMKHKALLAKAGWDFSSFLNNYNYQDESPLEQNLPGLANRRTWTHTVTAGNEIHKYFLSPMVWGGVDMEMEAKAQSFCNTHNTWLFAFKMDALFARPAKDSLVWEVRAPRKLNMYWPRLFRRSLATVLFDNYSIKDSSFVNSDRFLLC
jgi:hypothetical protein